MEDLSRLVRLNEQQKSAYLADIGDFIGRMEQVGVRDLDRIGYFDAPASSHHHLAEHSGLVMHSVNVTRWLLKLTETLDIHWPRASSPYLVGMLHDVVKCRCYAFQPGGAEENIVYTAHPYAGHGTASEAIISTELNVRLFPSEASAIIHHMGAFNLVGNALKDFDHALEIFPKEIIATHTADMMAARVDEEFNLKAEERHVAD